MALTGETKDTHTVKPDPKQKWSLGSYLEGVAFLFLTSIAVGNAWYHQYVLAFLMVIMLIFLGGEIIIHRRWWKRRQTRVWTAVACGIAGLILSFLIGLERADTILGSETASETIIVDDNKALPVRLIRGGDKGVLFFSLDTKVRFLRWESIKQIETGSPSSGLDWEFKRIETL
jgi:hypothetical protein